MEVSTSTEATVGAGHDQAAVRLSEIVEEKQTFLTKINPLLQGSAEASFQATLNLSNRVLTPYAVTPRLRERAGRLSPHPVPQSNAVGPASGAEFLVRWSASGTRRVGDWVGARRVGKR